MGCQKWPHCSPKTQFPTIFGLRTAQKRLRNGYRNGWETLERVASTSPSGNERPWEVSFASGQASRRVSRARVVVPPGAWSWVVTKYCRRPAYSDPKTHQYTDWLTDFLSHFHPIGSRGTQCKEASPSSMRGLMVMKLPTVVHYH